MTIKHLVIGGGGPGGFINYGALKESNLQGIWKYDDIKTIYATSAGGFIALPIILKINWNWIDDYIIKRPWHKVVKLSGNDYFRLLRDKALLSKNDFIDEMIDPLLKTADLDTNITLLELYNQIPIEFHLHSLNLNAEYENQLINISHITYPNLLLKEAIYMSMSVPLVFTPLFKDNNCFLDGGLLANIPLKNCLNETKCKIDELIVFKYNRIFPKSEITEKTGIWSYLIELFSIFTNNLILLSEKYNLDKIDNKILIFESECKERPNIATIKYWLECLENADERELLINTGVNYIKDFILTEKYKYLNFNKNTENYLNYYTYKNNIKRSYSF
jgi:predicted acylesterase/phospholipase RssA